MSQRTRPQKYQNTEAFDNAKWGLSTYVEKVAKMPVGAVCKRCADKLEWRKKFKKYKPLAARAKCEECLQKEIRHAYHRLCLPCGSKLSCCAMCRDKTTVLPMPKTKEEMEKKKQDDHNKLQNMRERERRSFLRKKDKDAKEERARLRAEAEEVEGGDAPNTASALWSPSCYVFGYGSLICANSRATTGSTGEAIPVLVKGFKRQWGAQVNLSEDTILNPKIKAVSYVSVESHETSECSGVLVEIEIAELPNFDYREQGYTRVKVEPNRVRLAAGSDIALPTNLATSEIWVYVANTKGAGPSARYPILQTYLDIIVKGCNEFDAAFAMQFLSTTVGWLPSNGSAGGFVNDRPKSGYPRFDKDASSGEKSDNVDRLVGSLLPKFWASRVDIPADTGEDDDYVF